MDDLGSPAHWRLKGEGNANLVFGYAGDAAHLVGTVLRVRKPRPPPRPEQQALEDAVWGPVLGGTPPLAAGGSAPAASTAVAAAAAREQRYVQQLLAPLLGAQHIPPQRPVRPSPGFLTQLLEASGCAAGGSGEAGDDPAAACVAAAALMPDVTLLPTLGQHAEAGGSGGWGPAGPAVAGPVVCVELKPKCGFVTACPTVHPANRGLKHSRSRYQLHQLLKLSQGKVGTASAYDPCDLFSGEPARLRAALAALLAAPQNNLALFVDGRRAALPGQKHKQKRERQEQQQQEQQQQQQEQQQECQQAEAALEELLGGLLPLPAPQRAGALVELLAAVLEREGVLPRLLAAQRQCAYDVEGVHRLYCRLAGLPQPAGAAADGGSSADDPGSSGSSGGGERHGSNGSAAVSASAATADGSEEEAEHAAAVQRLLSLPDEQAHAVLRVYAVAATAKDCAIMLALQRLAAPPPADAADAAQQAPQQEEARQQRAPPPPPPPQQGWAALPPAYVHSPAAAAAVATEGGAGAGGGWFQYRLCFVDLDQKPLAKVPAHAALDARILAAARTHAAAAEQQQQRPCGGDGGGDSSGDAHAAPGGAASVIG